MTTDQETFKNRKRAHEWLVDNGFSVAIGKFYEDINAGDKGIAVNPDKTISKYQVLQYGLNHIKKEKRADPLSESRFEADHRRSVAEAELAEVKARRAAREEDAYWLHAEQAWSVIAGVIGNLRDVIRRHLHDEQVRIVQAAGGDPVRSPEVFEYVDQVVGRAFNEVAGAPLDIQWEEEA